MITIGIIFLLGWIAIISFIVFLLEINEGNISDGIKALLITFLIIFIFLLIIFCYDYFQDGKLELLKAILKSLF